MAQPYRRSNQFDIDSIPEAVPKQRTNPMLRAEGNAVPWTKKQRTYPMLRAEGNAVLMKSKAADAERKSMMAKNQAAEIGALHEAQVLALAQAQGRVDAAHEAWVDALEAEAVAKAEATTAATAAYAAQDAHAYAAYAAQDAHAYAAYAAQYAAQEADDNLPLVGPASSSGLEQPTPPVKASSSSNNSSCSSSSSNKNDRQETYNFAAEQQHTPTLTDFFAYEKGWLYKD
jgi:membrane protein involved in colicin uptake